MKYTLNPNAVAVTILDESMLVIVGSSGSRIENMQGVNETGVYLWKLLEKGMEIDDIVANLMRDYEITEDEARPACVSYIKSLRDAGYLTLEE